MLCHECAATGEREEAVALCKFCFVGLCKPHLVELFQHPPAIPQYACRHTPGERAPRTEHERAWKSR